MSNVLLDFSGLPKFEQIKIDVVLEALQQQIDNNKSQIEQLVLIDQPSWHNFIEPFETMHDHLDRIWSPISHLNSVKDSDALREVYQQCLPILSMYSSEVGQDKRLFDQYEKIKQSPEFSDLNNAQKKVIDNALRDFKLSGVDLPTKQKDRLKEINTKLSDLTNRFSQNVLDATQGWHLDLDQESDLQGLPKSAIDAAQQLAQQSDKKGWRVSLDAPSFIPFMMYSERRDLREAVYRAYVTRASDQGPQADKWDNADNMTQIVSLRQEEALMLGFASYADYSLEPKMATNPQQVLDFLYDLSSKSRSLAKQEFAELEQFAKDLDADLGELMPWDVSYFSEKLRQQKFEFSDEDVRPYFPVNQVIDGLFKITGQLFGLDFKAQATPHVWHDDVLFYEITDQQQGQVIGHFYFDLYARQHKRGGAWMADCITRRKLEDEIQKPVAYLTCNFTPPIGDKTALLTHDEVITLFHEFGHGLHHLLTEVDEISVAGINGVAWDAVELPSQFLENWCWQPEGLAYLAKHHETNEPLPNELLEKMKAAKNFHSAMQMARQLEFSIFDMQLHQQTPQSADQIQEILDQTRAKVSVVPAQDFNRFQNGFSHIFAGGYAAGYYSYKWAEVLSADAFSRFEEEGVMNEKTGRSFRDMILAKGGVQEPVEMFKSFRGREPSIDALLRHSGIAT